jgi:cytochrome P450
VSIPQKYVGRLGLRRGCWAILFFGQPKNWSNINSVFLFSWQAKGALTEYFKYLIEKRKGQENSQVDMLGVLLAAQDDPQASEEVQEFDLNMIADNLLFFWLASYDTTSTTLTWIPKLLLENPEAFRRVQVKWSQISQALCPSYLGTFDHELIQSLL